MSDVCHFWLILTLAAVWTSSCSAFSFQVNGRNVNMSESHGQEGQVETLCQDLGLEEYIVSRNDEFERLQDELNTNEDYQFLIFWLKVIKRMVGSEVKYFWVDEEVQQTAWFHKTATEYLEPNGIGGNCNSKLSCCIQLSTRWGIGLRVEASTFTGKHELTDYSCDLKRRFFCIDPKIPTTSTAKPTATQPTTREPTTTHPMTTEPTTTHPTTTEPTTTHPMTTEPTTTQPTTTEPTTTQPTTAEPTKEPTTTEHVTTEATTELISTEQTTTKPLSTVPTHTDNCTCKGEVFTNVSHVQMEASIRAIKEFMTLDVSSLSATRRKLNSEPDDRPTSVAMGMSALIFLCLSYGLLFFGDLIGIIQQIREHCFDKR